MARTTRIRVQDVAVEEAIVRLEVYISRMERRYGRSSREMAEEVASCRSRNTVEVSAWLANFHDLSRLRETQAIGRAAG